jgi:hypothetical protein
MMPSLDPFQITTLFIWLMVACCCTWEMAATIWPGHVASISATMGRAFFTFPALLPLLITTVVWLLWHFWNQGHQGS